MALFQKKKGTQIKLSVQGMSCGHCEMRVKKALLAVAGVQEAEVSHTQAQAIVTIKPGQEVQVLDLVAAVTAAGYQAE